MQLADASTGLQGEGCARHRLQCTGQVLVAVGWVRKQSGCPDARRAELSW